MRIYLFLKNINVNSKNLKEKNKKLNMKIKIISNLSQVIVNWIIPTKNID
jgi:hypothetical protein